MVDIDNPGTRLGDYVTAKLKGVDGCRQGVYMGQTREGDPVIIGELEPYICEGDLTTVPDSNIFNPATRSHVKRLRDELINLKEQYFGQDSTLI